MASTEFLDINGVPLADTKARKEIVRCGELDGSYVLHLYSDEAKTKEIITIDLSALAEVGESGGMSGWSKSAVALLEVVLRNANYKNDQSDNITALIAKIKTGDDSGDDEEETTTYVISNSLTGCSSDNTSATIEKGASYTATITANDGYTLDSISVTMGSEDITSTAVSDNVITISNVTSDITITAVATIHQSSKLITSTSYMTTTDGRPAVKFGEDTSFWDNYTSPIYVAYNISLAKTQSYPRLWSSQKDLRENIGTGYNSIASCITAISTINDDDANYMYGIFTVDPTAVKAKLETDTTADYVYLTPCYASSSYFYSWDAYAFSEMPTKAELDALTWEAKS